MHLWPTFYTFLIHAYFQIASVFPGHNLLFRPHFNFFARILLFHPHFTFFACKMARPFTSKYKLPLAVFSKLPAKNVYFKRPCERMICIKNLGHLYTQSESDEILRISWIIFWWICYISFIKLLKGTGTRDLIWLKVVSLERSWWVGLTEDL